MIGTIKKVDQGSLPWYYRGMDGKGDKIFISAKKAEELMRKGIPVRCRCKAGDLRKS